MAYCLGTLVEIVEQILHPDKHHKNWVLDPEKRPQLQSLVENAYFLRNFLANLSPESQGKLECFEDGIREAAETAEDILEKHITDLVLSTRSWSQSFTISPPDLQQVIEQLETTKEKMMEIMGLVSLKYSSDDDPSNICKKPDSSENTTTFMGVVDAAAGQEEEYRNNDVYSSLKACVVLMKTAKHNDMKYMCRLYINTTEKLDSKSDIESPPSDGPNCSYAFEEINKDLIQLKDKLIALNLEILTDIVRTGRIAISEDMCETLKAQLGDVLVAVEHAYESYISVLTLLSRRNYLSTVFFTLLACKYGPTCSEILSIRVQMTIMAMAIIASKVPSRQPDGSLMQGHDQDSGQPSSLEIVPAGDCTDVKDHIRDALNNGKIGDPIRILKTHYISIVEDLEAMEFASTCLLVRNCTQGITAVMMRGPQITYEFRHGSAMHGQYPMRTMTGLEEESIQVIEEQFNNELLSANEMLGSLVTRGIATTDIQDKIETVEGIRESVTDTVQDNINLMETMCKKLLDALSPVDDHYLQMKDQLTGKSVFARENCQEFCWRLFFRN